MSPRQSIGTCVRETEAAVARDVQLKINEDFFVHKISEVTKHRLDCSLDVFLKRKHQYSSHEK